MSGLPRTVKRIRGTGWDAWALPSGMKGKWMKKIGLKKNDLVLTLILLPGLVYFIINNYMPMAGIFMAFKKVNFLQGIWASPWCGLDNFKFLFATDDAWEITRNTILYNLAFIILGTAMAIMIAVLMNEIGRLAIAKLIQPALLFPYLLSMVIVAYVVYAFLNSETGFINNSILGGEGPRWYSEAKYWPVILTIVYLWKSAGYQSIVYMAGIAGIDKSIYEAAKVDGASKLKQIFSITLPMLKPTIIIMCLMAIGKIFNSDFGLFYQVPMNSGALYSTTQTIDTYVYRGLLELNDVGMSSAASVYQSVVGFVLVMVSNLIVRKVDQENALF